jgi:hypothetical protein
LTAHPSFAGDEAAALKQLSAACSAFSPPSTVAMTNEQLETNSKLLTDSCQMLIESNPEDSPTATFGSAVIMNVTIDATTDVSSACEHIALHFANGTRVRTTLTNFMDVDPIIVGSIAGKVCDAGSEEVFLANEAGADVDDLAMILEEITYVDAPGGPMLGRLGLTYMECDEFLEEAIDTLGVAKYNVSLDAVGGLLKMAEARGLQHDITNVETLLR